MSDLVTFEEFQALAKTDPAVRQAFTWYRERKPQRLTWMAKATATPAPAVQEFNSTRPAKLYYDSALLQRLAQMPVADAYKWEFMVAWAPPVGDLTQDDFFALCQARFDAHSTNASYYSSGVDISAGWLPQHARPWSSDWRVWALICRLHKLSYGIPVRNLPIGTQFFNELLKDSNMALKYGERLVLLNEFLHSDFEGSFAAFEAQADENLLARAKAWDFVIHDAHEWENFALTFCSSASVINMGATVTAKARKLLSEQNREMWQALLLQGRSLSKGKTFQILQTVVEETQARLAGGGTLRSTLIEHDEFQRQYMALLGAALVREQEENPSMLVNVAKHAISLLPAKYAWERWHSEYSRAWQSFTEAASAPTMKDLLSFLLALTRPKSWLKNNPDNGPYLLADLFVEKGADAVSLLTGLILDYKGGVPSEAEWRKALKETDFAMSPEFFAIITCTGKNNQRDRPMSEELKASRAAAFPTH